MGLSSPYELKVQNVMEEAGWLVRHKKMKVRLGLKVLRGRQKTVFKPH